MDKQDGHLHQPKEIKYKSLIGISATHVDSVWHELRPYVEKALVKTKADQYYDCKHVYEEIKTRDAQLWAVFHVKQLIGAVVTKIVIYPKCKVLDMWLIGGDSLKTLEDTYGTLKAYAQSMGCKQVRGFGRHGWTRLVKDEKFHSAYWTVDL